MARPKKIEGGATTQPVTTDTSSAPNTTPAEGVSTTPEAIAAEPTQLDDTTTVTPAEGAVDTAALPLGGGSTEPTEAPVVPPSRSEDGTNPAPVAAVEEPLPLEVAIQPEQVAPVATSTPIPDGLGPKEMSLEDLDALGIPRPGARLTCASFENGQPVAGTVLRLSEALDVVLVLLDGLGWRWPVPTGRIDGATWVHDSTDHPAPGEVPAFDAEARRPQSEQRLEEPDSERPEVLTVSAADRLRERWAGGLRAFYGKSPEDVTDEEVVTFAARMEGELAPVAAVEAPALPAEAQPRKLSAEQVALGIPEHYIRCRIKGLGSISGHGLTEEGKPHENHVGGSVAYFTTATVKKLADLLTVLDES